MGRGKMMSKYMCLGCWTTAPAQVVLPDGQVITLTKPGTVGGLLDRCRNKDGYYVCEASTPGMNSPLFPRVPMAHNPLFDATGSPLQGGALLPPETKLQKGHLYFILPLPELSPNSLDRFRSGAYNPNSLSNLLRRSSGEEDLGKSRTRRTFVAGGSGGNHHQPGALKSAIARRISTRISPELEATLQSAGRPSPHKDVVYKLLAKPAVVQSSGDAAAAVEPVMQSWHDRPPNPARLLRRRRRSFRNYAGTWKPELPIISEDGTLGSCLCPPQMSDTDDDSITMLLGMTGASNSPSRISRPFKSPRRSNTSQKAETNNSL